MAVRLEKNVKRFIGSSTDAKPVVGSLWGDPGDQAAPYVLTAADLPQGSTFLEDDVYLADGSNRIAVWNGSAWIYPRAPAAGKEQPPVWAAVTALHEEIKLLRFGMIAAGACKDV